jgi:ABC-type bacteriocin/lantibiotic exporter with double-glycine peptidase domain
MYVIFKKIFYILNIIKKNKFSFIIFLTVARSFFEILSLGLLIPVLGILSNYDKKDILSNYKFSFIENFEIKELLILFISIFLLSYFLKTLFIAYYEKKKLDKCKDIYDTISIILIKNYLSKKYIYHINQNSSELIKNLTSETNLFSFGVISYYINILSAFFLIFFYCLFLIFYSSKTLFVIAAVFVLGYLTIIYTQKRFKYWGELRSELASKLIKIFDEAFLNIKMIKIFNLENKITKNAIASINQLSNFTIKRDLYLGMAAPVIELVSVLIFFIFLIILTTIYQTSYEKIIILFGLMAFASIKLLPSIINLIKNLQQIKFLEKNVNTIHDDINLNKDKLNLKELKEISKINLNNIKYFYKSDQVVFKNINIEINAQDKLAIIGTTGSGKSTLLNILCGLLEPNEGNITINNKNYKDVNFLNIFSYVPQKIYLFDNSILYNITFEENERNCDMEKFNKIIDSLQLRDLIQGSIDGVNTSVGQKGIKISGGQAQRIGLARALYAKFSILILDEATSSLDEKTENHVLNEIFNYTKDKIVVFATHRKKVLNYCNKILEINDFEETLKEISNK